jgi:hypothetical protein
MVGLDGILRCKLLVNHVETHVSRLRLQAEALCGLVNWEKEDAETSALHQVCCQLRHLSSECETSIDVAMDAIQVYIYTYIHTYTLSYTHTYIHTYVCYIHTYIYKNIYIYVQTYVYV